MTPSDIETRIKEIRDRCERAKERLFNNSDDYLLARQDLPYILDQLEKHRNALNIATNAIHNGCALLNEDYFENWEDVIIDHNEALLEIDEILK